MSDCKSDVLLEPENERDRRICEWLTLNGREGYVQPFLSLQKHSPSVLGWCNDEDIIAIFTNLSPSKTLDCDLSNLFSGLGL